MSSLDAAILNVVIERGADDGSAGSIGALRLATIYFDADGVAVAGGADTLGVQLNTAIQNSVRDGKTVTLGLPAATNVNAAMMVQSGLQGSTEFFAGNFAISSGNLTFNVANSSGTEVNAASGVEDRPFQLIVAISLS